MLLPAITPTRRMHQPIRNESKLVPSPSLSPPLGSGRAAPSDHLRAHPLQPQRGTHAAALCTWHFGIQGVAGGPQARLTIDKFVYDPAVKKGDLAVHASAGVFRFVGGKISKTRPVSIVTPSASLTIRGGILLVDVQPTKTVATFVFGVEMTVVASGVKRTVTRPGWQVTVLAGAAPTQPVQATPGSLSPEFAKLEAIRSQPNAGDPDQAMRSSGFDTQNSGRGPSSGATGPDSTIAKDAANALTCCHSACTGSELPVTRL
jgi:hypothetical protein